MVVVTTSELEKGEEVYVSYSKEYWETRLHLLNEKLRRRIRKSYPDEKCVRFRDTGVLEVYNEKSTLKEVMKPKNRIRKGVIINSPAKNLRTRKRIEEMKELVKDKEEVPDANLNEEEFDHDSVDQCEELADKLNQLLEGGGSSSTAKMEDCIRSIR